jgi:hypothetical protein
VSTAVNLENFFKKGDMNCNPPIEAGDAIYIDTRTPGQPGQNLWGLLNGLNLLNLGAHILTTGLGH